jgi:hypothetical protein
MLSLCRRSNSFTVMSAQGAHAQPVNGSMITFGDDPSRQMLVFMTGEQKRAFVVVGCQASAFFAHHSMRLLVSELATARWSTAQTQLASNMVGYGGRTHVGDAEDLASLISLLTRDYEMSEITLFGWSSGVQVVLQYLGTARNADAVTRVILQGVVNDPKDEIFSEATAAKRSRLVDEYMRSGREEVVVPIDIYDIPITAARLSTGGLPSMQEAVWQPATLGNREQLQANLKSVKVPLLLMIAMSTQYRPSAELKNQVKEIVAACASTPEVEVNFFEAAGDERRRLLRGAEAAHTAAIVLFLKECDRRRDEREEAARQAAVEEMRRNRSILAKSLLKGSA